MSTVSKITLISWEVFLFCVQLIANKDVMAMCLTIAIEHVSIAPPSTVSLRRRVTFLRYILA